MSMVKARSLATVSLTLAALTPLAGCFQRDSTVQVHVEAKTNQGEPVSGAEVTVANKILGTTDAVGVFNGQLSLPRGAHQRLEVRKASDYFYFAPYNEGFEVKDEKIQDLSVAATLYFVSKPKPQDELTTANAAAPKTARLPEKAAEPPAAPAPVEPIAAVPERAKIAPIDANTNVSRDLLSEEANAVAKVEPETEVIPEVPQAAPEKPKAVSPMEAASDLSETNVGKVARDLPDHTKRPQPFALSPTAHTPIAPESLADDDEDPGAPAVAAATKSQPLAATATLGDGLITVHAVSGDTQLADVTVLYGLPGDNALSEGCKTNTRGRCVIRLPRRPADAVTFTASKVGFVTNTLKVVVKAKDQIHLDLAHGQSLDIAVLTRSYHREVGLANVPVLVNGKKAGVTDQFGRFSSLVPARTDDLIAVALKPEGFRPEVFETDFVAGSPLKLVKYFTPQDPPPAHVGLLRAEAAGDTSPALMTALSGPFDEALRSAARKALFASAAFQDVSRQEIERGAKASGLTAADLSRKGWQDSTLKDSLDALLIPTVIAGSPNELELRAVDRQGHVFAAAKERLEPLADSDAIERAVANIATKLSRAYPFEGGVLSNEGGSVVINLGESHGRGLKPGDVLDVFGLQAERLGRSQTPQRIATFTVREVLDTTSKGSVSNLAPRAHIERGDLVVLRPRKAAPNQGPATLHVATADLRAAPVAQANVYLNDTWIGATDENGHLPLGAGSGTLRIVREGFADYSTTVKVGTDTKLEAALKRQSAYLQIASHPAGATIRLDGVEIGKTPLTKPLAVPAGFLKLELSGVAGFKTWTQVLELDQGTLNLTGDAAVALEQDFLANAQRQIAAGEFPEALATLNAVPKEHSDYLMSRHEAGELYLTKLDQPAKAAEAFSQVTSVEAVKQFTDKRFIATHVNEGVALFMTAERLAPTEPETARAHYEKALSVFEGVSPYLRFIATADYPRAVHTVDYHKALCRYRLWSLTRDPHVLAAAVHSWNDYLNGSAHTVPVDSTSQGYVDNAEIFLRQAVASGAGAKGQSQQ